MSQLNAHKIQVRCDRPPTKIASYIPPPVPEPKSSTVYYRKNGEIQQLVIKTPDFRNRGDSPSTSFTNPPTIRVQCQGHDLSFFRALVANGIRNNNLRAEHAVAFLYMKYKDIKWQSNEDWISYGLLICSKNEEICPWNLVKIVEEQVMFDVSSTLSETSDQHDLRYATFITAIYRIAQASNEYQKNMIVKEIKAKVEEHVPPHPNFDFTAATAIVYVNWANSDYLKIIATLDMFFNRADTHLHALIKVGTAPSRFKHCAALTAGTALMKATETEKISDLFPWILSRHVENDIGEIYKTREEIELPYSYFPYMMDLGIVSRSDYTVKNHPDFHFFCHAVSTALGSSQSRNVNFALRDIMLMPTILSNIDLMALAFLQDNGEIRAIYNQLPTSRGVRDWLKFSKDFPDQFEQALKMMWRRRRLQSVLTNTRENTVGRYLYEHRVLPAINNA